MFDNIVDTPMWIGYIYIHTYLHTYTRPPPHTYTYIPWSDTYWLKHIVGVIFFYFIYGFKLTGEWVPYQITNFQMLDIPPAVQDQKVPYFPRCYHCKIKKCTKYPHMKRIYLHKPVFFFSYRKGLSTKYRWPFNIEPIACNTYSLIIDAFRNIGQTTLFRSSERDGMLQHLNKKYFEEEINYLF